MRLSFIRHGQTVLLEQGNVLRGRTDDVLTTKGYQQMAKTFDKYAPTRSWQGVFSSPLSRCRTFASDKADAYGLPLFIVDELQEIDFGDWENTTTATLYERYPDELALYWQSPHLYTPPNAERVADFKHRILSAIAFVYRTACLYQMERVCVICHGGVIKMLYLVAHDLPMSQLLTTPVALGELHEFWYDGALQVADV
ncbi:MAG: histidine phosphatase family protein [Moraxella sp.]|nr:histidine phosphatase family protein [Moraxella sp.]